MTTREPGESEVFTIGFTESPRATALRARSPAASITLGFEVLVHEVIAAMTTSPWPSSTASSRAGRRAPRCPSPVGRLFTISYSVSVEVFLRPPSGTASGSCRPPPGVGAVPFAGRKRQRRESSSAGLP